MPATSILPPPPMMAQNPEHPSDQVMLSLAARLQNRADRLTSLQDPAQNVSGTSASAKASHNDGKTETKPHAASKKFSDWLSQRQKHRKRFLESMLARVSGAGDLQSRLESYVGEMGKTVAMQISGLKQAQSDLKSLKRVLDERINTLAARLAPPASDAGYPALIAVLSRDLERTRKELEELRREVAASRSGWNKEA